MPCIYGVTVTPFLHTKMLQALEKGLQRCILAPQRRFERPTLRLGGECSIP